MDYCNPVTDYYNPLLRFKPCLYPVGLKININLIKINSSHGLILIPCSIHIIPNWD